MKEALQMWVPDEPLLTAEEADTRYFSAKDLGKLQRKYGWTCPYCSEPVFFRPGTYRRGRKESEVIVVSASFCHYKADHISPEDHPCEIRSISSDGKKLRNEFSYESRKQRLKSYQDRFNTAFLEEEVVKPMFTAHKENFNYKYRDWSSFRKLYRNFVDLNQKSDTYKQIRDPVINSITEAIYLAFDPSSGVDLVKDIKDEANRTIKNLYILYENAAKLHAASIVNLLEVYPDKSEEDLLLDLVYECPSEMVTYSVGSGKKELKERKPDELNRLYKCIGRYIVMSFEKIKSTEKNRQIYFSVEFLNFLCSPINKELLRTFVITFVFILYAFNTSTAKEVLDRGTNADSLHALCMHILRMLVSAVILIDWNTISCTKSQKVYTLSGKGFA